MPAWQARSCIVAEGDAVAFLQPLARTHEGDPAVGRDPAMQGGLDRHRRSVAAAGLAAGPQAHQPGRDHAGVVEDQGVARPQEVGQLADDAVFQALGPA
jgi:hypothetical protein